MVDPLGGGPTQSNADPAALPVAPTVDPGWILVDEGFSLAREHELESLFAIGNGYAGSRGSLAEGSALSAPATFLAGVFDSQVGSVTGLVSTADWTVCPPRSTAACFGSIRAIAWSIAASSTCGKASSGGSGGIRTQPVKSRG